MGGILGSHPQLPRFKGVTFKIKCGEGDSTGSAPQPRELRGEGREPPPSDRAVFGEGPYPEERGGRVNHGMQLKILRAANGRFSAEGHTYIT